MVKQVVKYESEDGTVFDDKDDAIEYERVGKIKEDITGLLEGMFGDEYGRIRETAVDIAAAIVNCYEVKAR